MGTESADLLVREYKLVKEIVAAGDSPKALRLEARYKTLSKALLRERDQAIAERINTTLRPGEIGLLFLGMLHSLEGWLARDIQVTHPLYPPSPAGHPRPMTNGKSQVLVVDDEQAICQLISHLLEQEGFVPLVALDGKTALQRLRTASPDMLIVDLKLPDLDGLEILRQAKALDEDLPVVILTAYAEVHGAVEAMRAAAFDYLAKPYDHQKLVRVVRRALAERQFKLKLKQLACQTNASHDLTEIMGPSEAIGRLIDDLNRVAKSNFSVVIIGETGSGKEVVAQAIHGSRPARQRPLCAGGFGRDSRDAFRGGIVRARKGGVHRRGRPQAGPI